MNTVSFKVLNDDPVGVGDILRVAVMWHADPNDPAFAQQTYNGSPGVAAWGISVGWDRNYLDPDGPGFERTSDQPFMYMNHPRQGTVYRISQINAQGDLANDGDMQIICFSGLGRRGDTRFMPRTDGVILTVLRFEVKQEGETSLWWLEDPGESDSIVDNCVLAGNADPNWFFNPTWDDSPIMLGETGTETPPPPPPPKTLTEQLIELLLMIYAEGNDALSARAQEVLGLIIASLGDSDV